ncbi:PTS sugar transporter subunit IIA [Georgenia sp. SUBG003]|uniref:PTS sugar transporter subunit IIA n=1 Tax=Georgenia sp. SUBG003 TaxID=1497974 RepID=UPI0006948235
MTAQAGPDEAAGGVPVRASFLRAAEDWRDGVRAAARLLVDLGTADEAYVDACVSTVEEHGPYIVLTPGVALAHARAEPGTTTEGLAAVRLGEPVRFGHPTNDPVDVVLAFSSGGSHMEMIRAMGKALTGGLADRLREADDVTAAERALAEAVRHG